MGEGAGNKLSKAKQSLKIRTETNSEVGNKVSNNQQLLNKNSNLASHEIARNRNPHAATMQGKTTPLPSGLSRPWPWPDGAANQIIAAQTLVGGEPPTGKLRVRPATGGPHLQTRGSRARGGGRQQFGLNGLSPDSAQRPVTTVAGGRTHSGKRSLNAPAPMHPAAWPCPSIKRMPVP